MKRDVRVFLLDVVDCIDKIDAYTKGMSKDEFLRDAKTQDAVMRNVEIIGEAAKNIPEDFKKSHPNAPWSEMTRTRDKLIHGYFGVNAERIWFIIKDDLPEAKVKIQKILKKVEKEAKLNDETIQLS